MKITLSFFPNEVKKSKKTGRIPIYLRVRYNHEKAETRLNAELLEDELVKWDRITMRLRERNAGVNHHLARIDQKFQEFINLNATRLPDYNAQQIRDHVLGHDDNRVTTILKFADDYYQNSVMNNVNRMPGTIKNYRRSINHLINFLRSRKQSNMTFDQLTFEVANDFKNYLVNSDPLLKRIGMTEVSASGVIKKFRTIFNLAVEKELLKRNPFKLVKIKTKSPKRERLTIEQVKKICDLDLKLYPAQIIYRDIFLFCTLSGLAYQDTMNLTRENIETKENGLVKLKLDRTKTGVITESFLPLLAVQIINKYKNYLSNEITGTVIPRRSNKELNLQFKFLTHLANVPVELSTHIARHTFRQLLSEAGIEDYGVIKRMMGQSRNGDVDEIYYSVTESRLLAAYNKIESYLKIHLI